VKLKNSRSSNSENLLAHRAGCLLALGLWACTNSMTGTGPGGGPDDPGSSGSSGASGNAGTGGGSGATGQGGGAGTTAATGGGGGTSGASGTGGIGGTSGGGGPAGYNIELAGVPIHSHFVRITHQQWENSVRDLLKLTATPGLSGMFTSDPPEGTFSNNERALYVTSNLRLDYERAAEDLAKRVAGTAQTRTAIGASGNAATFISAFGRRVYRRRSSPPSSSATKRSSRAQARFTRAATCSRTASSS
jgi:hypothetical protein